MSPEVVGKVPQVLRAVLAAARPDPQAIGAVIRQARWAVPERVAVRVAGSIRPGRPAALVLERRVRRVIGARAAPQRPKRISAPKSRPMMQHPTAAKKGISALANPKQNRVWKARLMKDPRIVGRAIPPVRWVGLAPVLAQIVGKVPQVRRAALAVAHPNLQAIGAAIRQARWVALESAVVQRAGAIRPDRPVARVPERRVRQEIGRVIHPVRWAALEPAVRKILPVQPGGQVPDITAVLPVRAADLVVGLRALLD